MTSVMTQETLSSYEVIELQVGVDGQVPNNGNQSPTLRTSDIDAARLEQAANQIEILNRFAHAYPLAAAATTSSLNPEQLLHTFAREIVDLLLADACYIYEWDSTVDKVSLLASYRSWAAPPAADETYGQTIGSLIRRAVSERMPQQYALVQPKGDEAVGAAEGSGAKTILLLPMRAPVGKPKQLVLVESQVARIFSHHDLLSAQRLTGQASIALENAYQYQQLLKANAQLQTANKELEAFGHTVAHDLKGPLATVIGSAEFLKFTDGSWPQEDLAELTTIISESARKMLGIIDGLLLLATVDRTEVEIDTVDMKGAFGEARSRLENMMAENEAEVIVTTELPDCLAFRPWVEQVWTNLLSNAVKYGGQPPKIEVRAEVEADGMVRYWVKDSGHGLTKKQQMRLFQPFTRFHDKSVSGHGLGLSIVRRIIERLGGETGVESEAGHGSAFYFTLPGSAA